PTAKAPTIGMNPPKKVSTASAKANGTWSTTSPIPMSTASTAETRAWVRMKPLSVFHERVATSVTCAPARAPETRRTKGRKSGPSLRKKRSEEHTSELQSRFDLVCRLLLEKK